MTNKFWLYLSYGKPIVTCEIKNLINLPPDFIYQSKNTKEFINNVKKSYKDDTYECFKRRIDYSKNNSWDIRSSYLIDLFDNKGFKIDNPLGHSNKSMIKTGKSLAFI